MRWPIVLFFNMIDVDGVVAYNLYKCTKPLLLSAKAHLCDKKTLKDSTFIHSTRLSHSHSGIKWNIKTAIQQNGYKNEEASGCVLI
jgi:hypothetical protein